MQSLLQPRPEDDTGSGSSALLTAAFEAPAERRLGRRAAAALAASLAIAVGATTAGWVAAASSTLREQAEAAGRQTAESAATMLAGLAEPSATNVARTLDIVLDGHLRAAAAATALLIEAAETDQRSEVYIVDMLRQLVTRSALIRIDAVAVDGNNYSSGEEYGIEDLEPEFARLSRRPPEGRTASTAARQTSAGLSKSAGSQTTHRRMVVRIEQALDSLGAAETYGAEDDRGARALGNAQASSTALLLSHAVELAEDAGWSNEQIAKRLTAIVRNTAVERISAYGGSRRPVYEAASEAASRLGAAASHAAAISDIDRSRQQVIVLEGRYDEERRWLAAAVANRGRNRLSVAVEIATRGGEGSLAESGWQAEADRLAAMDGVTGIWVATGTREGVRLAAAAPRPQGGAVIAAATTAETETEREANSADAWSRWGRQEQALATAAISGGDTTAAADIGWQSGRARVRAAAPAPGGQEGSRIAIVVERRADEVAEALVNATVSGAVGAVGLIGLLAVVTTVSARRWLTGPIEEIAEAARALAGGNEPNLADIGRLGRRRDEIGRLSRSFALMTRQVLARHEELQKAVEERTRGLRAINKQMKQAQARIGREVALAKVVQQSLVPTGRHEIGTIELSSRMEPARDLGGDFVCVQELSEKRLFLAVADVSGKGPAAALFMACAQAALIAAARASANIDEIAAEANQRLAEGNDIAMFVTAILANVNPSTGNMDYICAGHEAGIIIEPTGRLRRMETTGDIPLGLDSDRTWHARKMRIKPGETLVMYTDGIPDACNTDEAEYGEQRLEEIVIQTHDKAPEALINQIWDSIKLFAGGAAPTDDKTCMAIRRHGESPTLDVRSQSN